jgi:hypothetical protein
LGESRIWKRKIWLWVPRDSVLRMTALARISRPIISSERMLHKTIIVSVQLENTIIGCESQGA